MTDHSFKVSINQLDEELSPDIPTMKAREQAMESMVHVKYRCPNVGTARIAEKHTKQREFHLMRRPRMPSYETL